MFFRLGMFDLSVAVSCFFAAGVAGGVVSAATPAARAHATAVAMAIALVCGVFLYLVLAPLAYRLCRARPMRFPKCPHCNAANGPWGTQGPSAPARAENMLCGQCGVATQFIYGADIDDAAVDLKPAYLLQWPRHLGIWKLRH